MQLRTRVIGAAGIAAVVAAGGSAFTASNTGVPPDKKLGFAQTSVTGAAVSAMDFTYGATANDVSTITYTLGVTDTTTFENAHANIKVGLTAAPEDLTNYSCVITNQVPDHPTAPITVYAAGLITCGTTNLTVEHAGVVQLVVTPKL